MYFMSSNELKKNAISVAKSNWSRHTKTVLKQLMNLYMYTQTNS